MKFHWICQKPSCLHDNKSEVDNIFVGDNGTLLIDLGACQGCGNPHRMLTIWNQRVEIQQIGVKKA